MAEPTRTHQLPPGTRYIIRKKADGFWYLTDHGNMVLYKGDTKEACITGLNLAVANESYYYNEVGDELNDKGGVKEV